MVTTVASFVGAIMQAYDTNQDEVITLGAFAKRRQAVPDESIREDSNTYTEGDKLITSNKFYGRGQLFLVADGDQDRRVSRLELTQAVGIFDANGDGSLDEDEMAHFDHAYPETLISEVRFERNRE